MNPIIEILNDIQSPRGKGAGEPGLATVLALLFLAGPVIMLFAVWRLW